MIFFLYFHGWISDYESKLSPLLSIHVNPFCAKTGKSLNKKRSHAPSIKKDCQKSFSSFPSFSSSAQRDVSSTRPHGMKSMCFVFSIASAVFPNL